MAPLVTRTLFAGVSVTLTLVMVAASAPAATAAANRANVARVIARAAA